MVACHLATTLEGRSCLADAGCLPRWLSRASELLPEQQQLLLMLPLACLPDWGQEETYYVRLFRDGQWVEAQLDTQGWATPETCPLQLRHQARSPSQALAPEQSQSLMPGAAHFGHSGTCK